jgi:hypothetical protein
VIDPADQADAGAFLVRLLRLDPGAVVRLRPARGRVELWAMLPFKVLVVRTLARTELADITVAAADLLQGGTNLKRRDADWRWPVPSSRGEAVEVIPAHEVARLAAAASRTMRAAAAEGLAGRAVGERVLRDALLDHVPIVVTVDRGRRVEVPQRMVQAVARMGFLGRVTQSPGAADTPGLIADTPGTVTNGEDATTITPGSNSVTVRLAMGWIGLDALHGSAWYRPISPLRLS